MLLYRRDSLRLDRHIVFAADDPYLVSLTSAWEQALKDAFAAVPRADWAERAVREAVVVRPFVVAAGAAALRLEQGIEERRHTLQRRRLPPGCEVCSTPGMDIREALYTTRAMRRVKPDPVPEDVQMRILDAAIRAPSGGNGQQWRFMLVDDEGQRQKIGELYRDRMVGAEHTFIIGLGNDEIGYQLPEAKWDDSCHACAPFILAGMPELCPLFPNIDCNTVFQNNVGADVDPAVSGAMLPLLDSLH